jgi:sugar/nucleoside kinase (ribokinase family)
MNATTNQVNKKYHVYGMGNALVDYEYLIDDQTLSDFQLAKSSMTLIDETLRATLFKKLVHFKKKKGGGSAANTLIAMSQLGGSVCYSCLVANDEDGKFYVDDLIKQGVSLHLAPKNLGSSVTGTCIVLVSNDAERTMCTYLGATSEYSVDEVNWEELRKATYLYIEGYLLCSDKGTDAVLKAIEFAKNNKIKIALTCSDAGVVHGFRARFDKVLKDSIDLIFCNEAESLALSGAAGVEDAIVNLQKTAKHVVITRSSKGVIVWDGNQIYEVPGRVVHPIDANGAGDMFAGAYMFGLNSNWGVKKAAEFACHLASEVIQIYGPRLEKEFIRKILSQY